MLEYCWDFPTFGYELRTNSLHNYRWIDFHVRGLMELWLAHKDFKLVVNIDKVIAYMKNYVTKPEIKIRTGLNKMIEKIINKLNANGLTTKAIL